MKIFIEETRRRYTVYLLDREPSDRTIERGDCSLLLSASRDPEFEACRALLDLGFRGRLEVWRFGSNFPSMILDIERAAKLMVEETDTVGPRLRRYHCRPDIVRVRSTSANYKTEQPMIEYSLLTTLD
jgi:hypothetical protein